MSVLIVDEDRLRELCTRYGIARLEVFGSAARGDAGPDSDIDLLYSLAPGHRLGWEIEDLAAELESLFGSPVDLVSRTGLNLRLRERVLSQARPLHDAA